MAQLIGGAVGLQLETFEPGITAGREALNAQLQILDEDRWVSGTDANRLAQTLTSSSQFFWYATDTDKLWWANGVSWVGMVGSGDYVDVAGDTMTGNLVMQSPATIALAAMTQGSVPFIGASGVLTEDNANLFWDDANNRLGVGLIDPDTDFHIDADASVEITLGSHGVNSNLPGMISGLKSRGTHASPTAVPTLENLIIMQGKGYDGTSYVNAGHWGITTSGTISTGIVPGRHSFATSNAAGTFANRMRLEPSGWLKVVENMASEPTWNLGSGGGDLGLGGDIDVVGNGLIGGTLSVGGAGAATNPLEVNGTGGMFELNDTSATGNPMMLFAQSGSRRGYIQYVDGGDYLRLTSEYGGVQIYTGTGGAETRKMTIGTSGETDIAANFAGYALTVVNDGNATTRGGIEVQAGEDTPTGTNIYFNALDGDGTTDGVLQSVAGVFALADTSDEILKKDIAPTRVDGLATLRAINLKQFRFKRQPDDFPITPIGFVAQDLETAFPEAVSTLSDNLPEREILPADAWDTVPKRGRKEGKRKVKRFRFDEETGEAEEFETEEEFVVPAPDGETERRLKPGVRLDEETGKFYRKRTRKVKGVTRTALIPVLVKAIQELEARVAALGG